MEPPPKRQKLSSPPPTISTATNMDRTNQTVLSETGFQPDREAEVGITEYVNTENRGFSGVFKQRYVSNYILWLCRAL